MKQGWMNLIDSKRVSEHRRRNPLEKGTRICGDRFLKGIPRHGWLEDSYGVRGGEEHSSCREQQSEIIGSSLNGRPVILFQGAAGGSMSCSWKHYLTSSSAYSARRKTRWVDCLAERKKLEETVLLSRTACCNGKIDARHGKIVQKAGRRNFDRVHVDHSAWESRWLLCALEELRFEDFWEIVLIRKFLNWSTLRKIRLEASKIRGCLRDTKLLLLLYIMNNKCLVNKKIKLLRVNTSSINGINLYNYEKILKSVSYMDY